MAQKKKEVTVKKARTTTKRITTTTKRTTTTSTRKPKEIIVQSIIPNYSSGQFSGHKNNVNVPFAPQQNQTATDNIVGELVGRLVNKIENDGNKQTQEYSKEIQPMNNNNTNTQNVYVYPSGKDQPDKKDTPSGTTTIINNPGRSAGEDLAIAYAAGAGSIGTAAIGTTMFRNRKSIAQGIKNAFTSTGNRLGGIAERSRLAMNPTAYRQHIDEVTPTGSFRSARSGNSSMADASEIFRRPSNASNASNHEDNILNSISEAVGISSARSSRARGTSSPSFYGSGGQNLAETFDNAARRTPSTAARRTPALNTEERNFVQRTLRNQNIDPENISPSNPAILRRARSTGIQQHDGVSTRNIRAQTMEPHEQLTGPRVRGRPRTRPLGPNPRPNPVGRPRSSVLSQAQTPPETGVTRNISNWKVSGKK